MNEALSAAPQLNDQRKHSALTFGQELLAAGFGNYKYHSVSVPHDCTNFRYGYDTRHENVLVILSYNAESYSVSAGTDVYGITQSLG